MSNETDTPETDAMYPNYRPEGLDGADCSSSILDRMARSFWRAGWQRAWRKRQYPANIKPFGRAWMAGMKFFETNVERMHPHENQ